MTKPSSSYTIDTLDIELKELFDYLNISYPRGLVLINTANAHTKSYKNISQIMKEVKSSEQFFSEAEYNCISHIVQSLKLMQQLL